MTNSTIDAPKRDRNYSFLAKNPDKLEEIEVDGNVYVIPSQIGSTYWAILKVCYENFGKEISEAKLCDKVQELMTEYDIDKWEKYKGKTSTAVYKKTTNQVVTKEALPWEDRIITNAKTLTRVGGDSGYGLRVVERGQKMSYKLKNGAYYFKIEDLDETNI